MSGRWGLEFCILSGRGDLHTTDPNIKPSVPEDVLEKLLKLCVCDNTFIFNDIIYEQIDGLAMGSSLAPLLANVYMAHLEEEFFFKTAMEFSPTFYRRYVDDTFCLFRKKEHIQQFVDFMNSIDSSIQFEMEVEIQDQLSFLDTVVSRNTNNTYPEINTKVKPTDKGLFYHFNSFIPDAYKNNLMYCLISRMYRIASSYAIFHPDGDLMKLKNKFLKNGFPSHLFDSIVERFLNNQYNPRTTSLNTSKRRITVVLPYLGPLSIIIRRKLKKLMNKFYHDIDMNIVFKRGRTIKNMFSYKDKLPIKCSSGVVYKIQCEVCGPSAAYVGKTVNTLHERFYGPNGHLNPSTKKSALLEHIGLDVHPLCEFNTNKIKIIDACNGDLKLRFAESIHLKHSKQTLNTQERSIPLKII